jgi:hypothetical protein
MSPMTATRARLGFYPFANYVQIHFVHRSLRASKGEPIKGFCNDPFFHENPCGLPCYVSPRITGRGLVLRDAGDCRQSRTIPTATTNIPGGGRNGKYSA